MEFVSGVFVFSVGVEFFGEPRVWHLTGIETRRGLVLFDVGGLDDADALKEALDKDGFGFGDLEKIVVTHHDIDHAGCIPEVLEESDAEVLAHAAAVPYLRGEKSLLKRPSVTYDPAPVDIHLVGGEVLETRAGDVEVLHTPGHAPDHLSFYIPDKQVLIAADLFHGEDGLTGPSPDVTPDMDRAIEEMEPLLSLDIEYIVCFHGGVVEAGPDAIQRVIDEHHA